MKTEKLNTTLFGLIAGLVFPLFGLLGFYLVNYNQLSVGEFVQLLNSQDILIACISLSVVINLLLFFIGMWTENLYASRGVLTATFVYAIFVFIAKIFF